MEKGMFIGQTNRGELSRHNRCLYRLIALKPEFRHGEDTLTGVIR